jgi:hypothetical protein
VISIAAPCTAGFSTSVSTLDIDLSSLFDCQENLIQPIFALATLYNTGRPRENSCLFFFLIVVIGTVAAYVENGVFVWIPKR